MQKIQFDYFRGMEAEQYSFYRVPKVLFTEDCFKSLSCEARVLYGLMLDRMNLSVKNRWFDEEDRVYIIFKVEEIMDLMCCKTQKAVKLMKELDTENGIGLIEKKRPGLGRPNVIYVKNFMVKEIGGTDRVISQDEDLDAGEQVSDYEEAQLSAMKEPEAADSQELECGVSEMEDFRNAKDGMPEVADSQNIEREPENAAGEQKGENQNSRILKIKNQEFPKSKARYFENQKSGVLIRKNQGFPESKVMNCENRSPGVLKIKNQEFPKSKPNNTDFSNTDYSDTDSIHPDQIGSSGASVPPADVIEEMNLYREIIRDKISYERFADARSNLREEVDELVELVVDVMMMPDASTLRIAGVERPAAVVKNRFMKLEQSHIEYVTGCLQRNTSKVENIKAYLLTTLYNATMTIDNYYRAEVNYDLYGSHPV